MTVTIFGVDGGLSTGLAELRDGRKIFVMQDEPARVLTRLAERITLCTEAGHTILVAYELFRQSGRAVHSAQPEALETAVRAQTIAMAHGCQVVAQTPGEAKRIASTAFLKGTGLWTLPGEVGQEDANDANDAMRHAILALARNYATQFDILMVRAVSGR